MKAQDTYDDLAEALGVTRASAVRTYAPLRAAELEAESAVLAAALHAVLFVVRESAPDLLEVIRDRMKEAAAKTPDFAPVADAVLAATEPAQ